MPAMVASVNGTKISPAPVLARLLGAGAAEPVLAELPEDAAPVFDGVVLEPVLLDDELLLLLVPLLELDGVEAPLGFCVVPEE